MSLQKQYDWLRTLPPGTRVVSRRGTFIFPKWENFHANFDVVVDIHTGYATHRSNLADEDMPPRIECYQAPDFSSFSS